MLLYQLRNKASKSHKPPCLSAGTAWIITRGDGRKNYFGSGVACLWPTGIYGLFRVKVSHDFDFDGNMRLKTLTAPNPKPLNPKPGNPNTLNP